MGRISRNAPIAAVSAVVACACALAAPLHAQEQAKTSEGVSYISGGVGEDSRDRLNSQAREYNLRVMFTLNEGNFLSGLPVTVTDAKGKRIIEAVADGPFFMAKVPAGTYTVAATH